MQIHGEPIKAFIETARCMLTSAVALPPDDNGEVFYVVRSRDLIKLNEQIADLTAEERGR